MTRVVVMIKLQRKNYSELQNISQACWLHHTPYRLRPASVVHSAHAGLQQRRGWAESLEGREVLSADLSRGSGRATFPVQRSSVPGRYRGAGGHWLLVTGVTACSRQETSHISSDNSSPRDTIRPSTSVSFSVLKK